jgi:hypothetical protein
LTVEELISDVKNVIGKINLTESLRPEDSDFYVRAALVLVSSIPDHLLEEYNQKYDFGIKEGDELTPSAVQRKIYSIDDPIDRQLKQNFLTDFIRWKNKLKTWPRVKFVLDTRNFSVHRSPAELENKALYRPGVGHSATGHLFFSGTSTTDEWTVGNLLGFTLEKMQAFVDEIRAAHL